MLLFQQQSIDPLIEDQNLNLSWPKYFECLKSLESWKFNYQPCYP